MADKKVIAVTTVHRTLEAGEPGDKSKGIKPKAPKIQVIQAGTIFMASTAERKGYDQSEYDELKALGAIRDPEKDEKVAVSVENIVADGADGSKTVTTKTTTSTTASGTGSASGKGSTAKTGGEGKETGDAKGAKAGEGPNQSGSGTTGKTGTTGDDLV
ncbi:MAG: hypothetical protein DI533_20325 [Cereibacter sphaeroides]|uniref:Uncharacterized protein n=1 Tax=Cereibacter sphaeroides TaxID=1063 RepID=A0A2W5UB50_CERSP|nr:MAG: hypothetical protein DI533_20325 [Cereibacter sphaeroides]